MTEPIKIPFEADATDFLSDAKKVQAEMDALKQKLKESGVSQAAYNKAVQDAKKIQQENAEAMRQAAIASDKLAKEQAAAAAAQDKLTREQAAAAAAANKLEQETLQAAAAQDKLERETEQAAAAQRSQVTSVKSSGMAWTEFRSIYSTVLDVARVAGQVWQETGAKFVEYAGQVRDVSRALGSRTEEASRLIQVADDVNISYQSLTTSMKMAQKDGIDPSIEGLAKLSDQYLALAPGVERTKFLLDKFGKSGGEMGKLMEKGGAGIRAMSSEIDKSLVLTQKAVDSAREYEVALDNWNDSVMALKVSIGNELLPTMTKMLVGLSNTTAIRDEANRLMREGIAHNREEALAMASATIQEAAAAESLAKANSEASGSFEDLAQSTADTIDPVKELKDELDKLYAANKEALDFTLSYADFQMGYNKDHAEAVSKVTEAQQALNDKIAEGGSAKEIESATAALDDAKAGMQELEASWHESTQKMVYDMVLVKLEADGLTESEMRAAEDLAVTKGITTQEQIDQARMLRDEATAIFEGIKAQEDVKREDAKITADMQAAEAAKANQAVEGAAIDGGNTVVGMEQQKQNAINQTTAALMRQSSMYNVAGAGGGRPVRTNSLGGQSGGRSPDERDSGGIGVAGVPYIVNPIAAPEMFIPQTNGTFIPNADRKGLFGGGDKIYNVVINNPKVEASEDSIRNALKKMQYGVV